jgi:amino acid transporter
VLPAIGVGAVAIAILVVNLGNAKIFLVVTSVSIVIVYIAYLLVTVPAMMQRRRNGWPEDQGRTGWFFLGRRRGLLINGTAIGYGALMAVNLIWPRSAIYGGGAYAWGGVIFVAALGILGAVYYLWRQHGRDHEVSPEHRAAPLAGAAAATGPGSTPDELGG